MIKTSTYNGKSVKLTEGGPSRDSALSAAENLLKHLDSRSEKVRDFIELAKIVNDQEIQLINHTGEELLYELFCDWRVNMERY